MFSCQTHTFQVSKSTLTLSAKWGAKIAATLREAASAAATVPVAMPPAPQSPAKPAVLPATAPAPATALSVLQQVEAALSSAAALAPWTLVDLEGLEEDARDSLLGEKLYA